MASHQPIRLCEWSRSSVAGLPAATRRDIAAAVAAWTESNRLPDAPLAFSGADGTLLDSTHYVGVVEVQGCTIEIYPKLDASILQSERVATEQAASTVMRNLLWMLEVAGYMDLAETDVASLTATQASYYDLFAFLFAKNLLAELERGVVHSYRELQDDLPSVRGRIDLLHQCTQNWGRMDRQRCRWDEFTSDTPMNRLFKSACTHLQARVRNPEPVHLLGSCAALLDDVADVDPRTALRDVRLRWDRSNDRFRRSFDMARRLLAGSAYEMASGPEDVFVFLLDMNHVFESFVTAAASARFGVPVVSQGVIGHLVNDEGRPLIQQIPDMKWTACGETWIGDAKYKRIVGPVGTELEREDAATNACRLSSGDVRQLTVYGSMAADARGAARLAIFYPSVGDEQPAVIEYQTWNKARLQIVPVRLDRQQRAADVVPRGDWVLPDSDVPG